MPKTFTDYQNEVAIALGWADATHIPTALLPKVKRCINDAQRDIASRAPWHFLTVRIRLTEWVGTGAILNFQAMTDPITATCGPLSSDPSKPLFYFGWRPASALASETPVTYLPPDRFFALRAAEGADISATVPKYVTVYYDAAVPQTYLQIYPPSQGQTGCSAHIVLTRAVIPLANSGDYSMLPVSVENILTTGAVAMALESIAEPELLPRATFFRSVYERKLQRLLEDIQIHEGGLSGMSNWRASSKRWAWRSRNFEGQSGKGA